MNNEINIRMYRHKGLLLSFKRWGSGRVDKQGGGGGRGDMPKIPPLSHHRQAKLKIYKWVNP